MAQWEICKHNGPTELYLGDSVCTLCGLMQSEGEYVTEYRNKGLSKAYYTRTYEREEYVLSILSQYLGQKTPYHFTQNQLVQKIIKNVPSEWTWKDVWAACTQVNGQGCNAIFKYLPSLFGLKPVVPPAFNYYIREIEKYWTVTKNPNILYIIYKFVELEGLDTAMVPIKTSKPTLLKYDKIWQEFCLDYNLPYIKSQVYTYPLNKLIFTPVPMRPYT